jgi:hypothetical protein
MQMQPTSHEQTPENPAGTSSVRRSPRDGEILCIGAACRGSQDDMVAHVHAGRPARHAGLLRPAHVGCLLRCVLSCSTLLACWLLSRLRRSSLSTTHVLDRGRATCRRPLAGDPSRTYSYSPTCLGHAGAMYTLRK